MAWRRGQALGQDLRDRVLADAGRPARAVAARFGVSVSYVVKARQRLRGSVRFRANWCLWRKFRNGRPKSRDLMLRQ